ncbi:hypothetical protein WMQ67_24590 [Vibrio harveyi]|uniref:hypothetical protein n=1 Tax=Vibrio harveyi TaxID=669 RepID=UPI0028A35760|nr:hypothetical protein [Vibrio vulnificus]HDY7749361.1 hypothetical protein [Vibrio vulnificus]HDY7763391.1 hypothetical protein [Vibrio vulnificus]HDY7772559.1 hypothetical protein [Vibrio vulnificus]
MKLMNQPLNGQLGNDLIDLLDSQDYDTLNIVVAFAKSSGVLRIKDSLDKFRRGGGTVNAFLGVDLGVTSYEALTALLLCTDTLSVVHSEKSQTFHTKIYQFLGKEKGMIVVGSHNLTGGGLWTNFESSAHIPIDISNPDSAGLLEEQEEYFNVLASLTDSIMPIESKEDVDKLLKNGYISKEVSQQVRQRQANKLNENVNPERLFGNGVPATLPRISEPSKDKVTAGPSLTDEQEIDKIIEQSKTIWFETRRLTGGSRNILDLSMRSLVEKGDPKGTPFDLDDPRFMRGGVEFFGINPSSTDVRKDITLNFEGVDYAHNTILFPTGDSANGTWRLQIKGVSSSEEKITDAFRSKGEQHYLVQKVVTFTKVTDDYYSIAVFPESELKNFETASSILARNGATKSAKLLGLL